MSRIRTRGMTVAALLGLAAVAQGQSPTGGDPLGLGSKGVLKASIALAPRARPPVPGGLVTLNLTLTIEDGWHIYANPAGDESVRPTVVGFEPKAPVKILGVDYPPGTPTPQPGADVPVLVYEPKVTIPVRLQLKDDVSPGPLDLKVQVRYQPCNDRACLAPAVLAVPVRIEVQGR